MNTTYFNPFGTDFTELSFTCPNCGTLVESDGLSVPYPDLMAESTSESTSYAEFEEFCSNCEKEFNIQLQVDFGGGYIIIPELPEDVDVFIKEISEQDEFIESQIDAFLNDTDKLIVFRAEMNKLKQLVELAKDNPHIEKTLLKQVYTGCITCLEDYLSTTLIQAVLKDREVFKNFILNDKELSARTFKLAQIFDVNDKLEKLVKDRLLSIQFHNMGLVKKLYKIVFEYEIKDISLVSKMVSNRHDLVHRNGRNKDGVELEISNQSVLEGIDIIERFVQNIDNAVCLL